MGVVEGNPEFDKFFDKNFELSYLPVIKKYIADRDMEYVGRLMWAIWLAEDPDSKLYNLDYETRWDAVKRNYLEDENFQEETIDDLIIAYKHATFSRKKRMYDDYIQMMDERHAYLKQLTYDEDADRKDKLVLNTKKIWDELAKIEEEYLKESTGSTKTKGDVEESATEKGLI
jgi:hypothetical protein